MIDIIYKLIYWIADMHSHIMSINNNGGYYFDDKELHFIVIGVMGLAMVCFVHPLFKFLAKHDHTMVITWIYVFTLVLVITFAIEIGQWYSGTGTPETADIYYGISGFLVLFAIFAIIRGLCIAIYRLVTGGNKSGSNDRDEYYL